MSEQQELDRRRRREFPSINSLDREFDNSLREEKERETGVDGSADNELRTR
jgi:hypothetical protein